MVSASPARMSAARDVSRRRWAEWRVARCRVQRGDVGSRVQMANIKERSRFRVNSWVNAPATCQLKLCS
jgi:hypothetical protein